MSVSIKEIKGVSAEVAEKSKEAGYADSDAFLAAAKTPADRKALAEKLGIDTKAVLEIANRCDLTRVKGVAGVYSDLLEEAGVDTIKELRNRVPANLFAKLSEVNEAQSITQRPPTEEQVADWVSQAKSMEPGLEY